MAGRGRRPAFQKKAIRVTPLPLEFEGDGKVRLNKFLAHAGICSRRAADDLIRTGRIKINGEAVTELGVRVDPAADEVMFDGNPVRPERKVYLLLNKPKGVVCTNARNEQKPRAIDLVHKIRGRVYTVGRLDVDSEGLILITNDGDFAQAITHPRHEVAKVYAVLLRGAVTRDDLDKVRSGVWLSEGRTGGARVTVERRSREKTYLKLTITEGKNREIRRVFARLGYNVLSLKRVRLGGLTLHGLGAGKFRFLKPAEVQDLLALAQGAPVS